MTHDAFPGFTRLKRAASPLESVDEAWAPKVVSLGSLRDDFMKCLSFGANSPVSLLVDCDLPGFKSARGEEHRIGPVR
jgi:hypothetical protein